VSAPELTPAILRSQPDRKRKNVIVILHELSRTGAPILGLNIIRRLRDEHDVNVIGVSLRGGELRDFLNADATVSIVRDWSTAPWGGEAADLATRLLDAYSPAYVIANSTSTFALGLAFCRRGARVVGLVHEFGMFLQGSPGVADFFAEGDELVFPVELVRTSISDLFPVVQVRRTRLLPQGQSAIPGASKANYVPAALPAVRDGAPFVVLGAGSIDWRKGIDLFLATAASLHRRYPDSKARFVWVGDSLSHDPIPKGYLIEQMKRTNLGKRFALFPATRDLEDVYRSVDAFFVSSRLDPLPNVAIDAAFLGLPVVCFDKATGFAEILQGDEIAEALVAPHLDVGAAADLIYRLETDVGWRRRVAQATASLSIATFDMGSYVSQLHGIGMKVPANGLAASKHKAGR